MSTPTTHLPNAGAGGGGIPATMRAATVDRYGSANVVAIEHIDVPSCQPDGVLIEVRAASVNPFDWHMMTGTPWLVRTQAGIRRPKSRLLGSDVSGVIVAIGDNVTGCSLGDAVFGGSHGSFAEYANITKNSLVAKPDNVSFEQAAAVPIAALTALQALRDHGQLTAGQRVLVNGASGGVGSYAIQLAKYLGAEVTGVCSSRNVDMVRALGADHVIDYNADDFTDGREYDLILDNIGNRKIAHIKRCLSASGSYVVVGGPKRRVLGPVGHMIKTFVAFRFGSRRSAAFIAKHTLSDMELFRDLLESGELRSVIDTVYPLDKIAEALRHLETGRARGKIIISG